MYFELLTSSCVESQAVVCAGGREGWRCCGLDQLYSLVWQGSADISERDCLHRELSSRRFRAAEADDCPQNRCWLDCTLLQHRVGECGKACLQFVKDRRTLCFIHWLSLRPALLGWQSDQCQCEQGQEAQPGAEGGAARAGLSWHRVLGPTWPLGRWSIGCKSFPVSE